MKYLRFKAAEFTEKGEGNRDTSDLILHVLRAPKPGGMTSADVVARAKVERDLNESLAKIKEGGAYVLAFEDDRAAALQKAVAGHSWPGYAMPFADFIEAVETMPSKAD